MTNYRAFSLVALLVLLTTAALSNPILPGWYKLEIENNDGSLHQTGPDTYSHWFDGGSPGTQNGYVSYLIFSGVPDGIVKSWTLIPCPLAAPCDLIDTPSPGIGSERSLAVVAASSVPEPGTATEALAGLLGFIGGLLFWQAMVRWNIRNEKRLAAMRDEAAQTCRVHLPEGIYQESRPVCGDAGLSSTRSNLIIAALRTSKCPMCKRTLELDSTVAIHCKCGVYISPWQVKYHAELIAKMDSAAREGSTCA